jgi:hypothetical protein
MRIYFAGKIDRNDWRSELFGLRTGAAQSYDGHEAELLLNPG